jgi:hypothetical protein
VRMASRKSIPHVYHDGRDAAFDHLRSPAVTEEPR